MKKRSRSRIALSIVCAANPPHYPAVRCRRAARLRGPAHSKKAPNKPRKTPTAKKSGSPRKRTELKSSSWHEKAAEPHATPLDHEVAAERSGEGDDHVFHLENAR